MSSSNIDKASIIREQPSTLSFAQRTAIIAILSFSALAVVSITSEEFRDGVTAKTTSFQQQVVSSTLDTLATVNAAFDATTLILSKSPPLFSLSVSSIPYIETKGRQPIRQGCANLYGSDWDEFPNTRAVVVCDDQTFGFSEAQINDIGFAKDDENHGISYVETGANAIVTLYTENDYGGDQLTIFPNKKVWLEQVSINGGSTKWNDKVQSILFQGHEGVFLNQITGIKPGNIPPCADHCILAVASDPWDPLGPHFTDAYAMCADPNEGKVTKFSYTFLKSQGCPIFQPSKGVSYVFVGEQVSLEMFQGPNFNGNSVTFNGPPPAGDQGYDLQKIKYPEEGSFDGWNDKPASFIITLKDA